jgi:hypothetical protein
MANKITFGFNKLNQNIQAKIINLDTGIQAGSNINMNELQFADESKSGLYQFVIPGTFIKARYLAKYFISGAQVGHSETIFWDGDKVVDTLEINDLLKTRMASSSYLAPDNSNISKIAALIEDDGTGKDRFKAKALEQSPSGGGSGLSEATFHNYLQSFAGKDDYKADSVNLGDMPADVAAIKSKTDNLPSDPASNTQVNTRLASADYTAPDNTKINSIKFKTDNLPTSPSAVSDIPSLSEIAGEIWSSATRTLTDKSNFELSSSQVQSLAVAIEAALLNEGDSQQLLDAISQKINQDFDLPAVEVEIIASAVKAKFNSESSDIADIKTKIDTIPSNPVLVNDARLNNLDTTISSRSNFDASSDIVEANIKQVNNNSVTSVSDFKADSVDLGDMPADVAAIKSKTDNLPVDPASNTQVNSRLASASYMAPDNTNILAIKNLLSFINSLMIGTSYINTSTNEMIHLDENGDVILKHNLKDAAGNLNYEQVFSVEKVSL